MVSLQTAISPTEEEKKKPCVKLESRTVVSRKRKLSRAKEEEEKGSNLFCKLAKKAREKEGRVVMELNLLDAHPELKVSRRRSRCRSIDRYVLLLKSLCIKCKIYDVPQSKGRHSMIDSKSLEVGLDLNLELNLSCTPSPSKIGCLSKGGGEEEEKKKTMNMEEEIEEMVATVCMRCHMLVMMTKVALSCPNCKFVHSPDQSSSLALIKPV